MDLVGGSSPTFTISLVCLVVQLQRTKEKVWVQRGRAKEEAESGTQNKTLKQRQRQRAQDL